MRPRRAREQQHSSVKEQPFTRRTFRESSATSPTRAGTVSRISREGGVTCSRSCPAVIRPGTFARVISRRRVRGRTQVPEQWTEALDHVPLGQRSARNRVLISRAVTLDNGRRSPKKLL